MADILPLEHLEDTFRSFNWNVICIDGHNMEEILQAFEDAKASHRPTAILAKTVKGKGVSFMENDNAWHQNVLTDEKYAQAVQEVEA